MVEDGAARASPPGLIAPGQLTTGYFSETAEAPRNRPEAPPG